MKETSLFFLVPTPIGNLEDITLRAVRILREVDLILAEDTRTTGVLLKHHSIRNKMKSYHAFNEHTLTGEIIRELKSGTRIALVTDAGTPGISDPGYLIVKECIENQIPFECLPGPTALVPALVVSGIAADSFVFLGFIPVKKGRNKFLSHLEHETRTMILYESPHKLLKSIDDLIRICGAARFVSVSRELSKLYEETVRGSLEEIREHFARHSPRGEFIVVLSGKPEKRID